LKLQFTPFPILKTERLILRELRNNDAAAIWAIRSDERVNKFIDRPLDITVDDAIAFITEIIAGIAENKWIYWVIEGPGNNLAGTICFWNISEEKESAEIGYELHPDSQGKGIMNESIAKIISYGFNTMELQTITAFPNADNERSIKQLEKFNFTIDTKLAEEFKNKEELENFVIYSLSANNFRKDYSEML